MFFWSLKLLIKIFPGTVDMNPPANDLDSILGLERSHKPQNDWARVHSSWAHVLQLMKPARPEPVLHTRESTAMRPSHSSKLCREPLLTATTESLCSTNDPVQPKKKKKI